MILIGVQLPADGKLQLFLSLEEGEYSGDIIKELLKVINKKIIIKVKVD